MASIYDTTIDPNLPHNSHASTLDIVGYNKHVLEVGCATGYFTKALIDRGCTVVGVELDAEAAAMAEKWAEKVVVGDLDAGTLWQELDGELFDAVTFGDVLEHLRDPLASLRAGARHLKPSGIIVISVPNIAHGDVRIALLQGDFPYRDTGLLDRTHIRFFTKSGLREMIREAGLIPVETRRVLRPLFQTELAVPRESVDEAMVDLILSDPEAETYQFVVTATLDNGTHALAALAHRADELGDLVQDGVVRTALLHREMEHLRAENEHLRAENESYRLKLHTAGHESVAYRQQLEAVLNTKTFRLLGPFRQLYGRFRRSPKPTSAASA